MQALTRLQTRPYFQIILGKITILVNLLYMSDVHLFTNNDKLMLISNFSIENINNMYSLHNTSEYCHGWILRAHTQRWETSQASNESKRSFNLCYPLWIGRYYNVLHLQCHSEIYWPCQFLCLAESKVSQSENQKSSEVNNTARLVGLDISIMTCSATRITINTQKNANKGRL